MNEPKWPASYSTSNAEPVEDFFFAHKPIHMPVIY
jgi:hypothetical protein